MTALEEFFPLSHQRRVVLNFITNNRVQELQISAHHPPPSARINSNLRPSDKRAAQLAQPRAGGPEGGNKVRSKPPHLFDRDQTLRPEFSPPHFWPSQGIIAASAPSLLFALCSSISYLLIRLSSPAAAALQLRAPNLSTGPVDSRPFECELPTTFFQPIWKTRATSHIHSCALLA